MMEKPCKMEGQKASMAAITADPTVEAKGSTTTAPVVIDEGRRTMHNDIIDEKVSYNYINYFF